MLIGQLLRDIREARNLTQRDLAKRTGLLSYNISRIENCHAVPALGTLEKFARALEVSLGALFYESELRRGGGQSADAAQIVWGKTRREREYYRKMVQLVSRMTPERRGLLLDIASRMVQWHEWSQQRSGKA